MVYLRAMKTALKRSRPLHKTGVRPKHSHLGFPTFIGCHKKERGEESGTGRKEKQPRTLNIGSEVEEWNLFQQKKKKPYFPLGITLMEFYTMKLKGTPAQILNPLGSDSHVLHLPRL